MAAQIRMRDAGGTLHAIDGSGSSRIRMRDAGGTLRTITRIRMRDASNQLRVVYEPSGATAFAVSASPGTVNGHGNGTATTGNTTAAASGGTPPYSYAWTLTDHTNSTPPSIGSASAATTSFTQTNIAAGDVDTADFRVTATDSAVPANTATDDVHAIFVDSSTI